MDGKAYAPSLKAQGSAFALQANRRRQHSLSWRNAADEVASRQQSPLREDAEASYTPEGLERSRRSNWKHGYYSAKAKRVRRDARQQYRLLRQLIAAGNEDDVLDLISST